MQQQQHSSQVQSPRIIVQQPLAQPKKTPSTSLKQPQQHGALSFVTSAPPIKATLQHHQNAQQPLSPASNHKRHDSIVQAKQSAISHFTQPQQQISNANDLNPDGIATALEQQELRQQAKSGRIGIFGNYLASRISSFQQQKFLLNNAAQAPSGYNTNNANAVGAGASQASNSNPLTSRKVSVQPPITQHSNNDQMRSKQVALMNVTSNSVTNGITPGVGGAPVQGGGADLQNSFMFGVSNFGSVSTSNDQQMVAIAPAAKPQGSYHHMKTKSGGAVQSGKSPFSIQGHVKKISNREDEIAAAEAQKKNRKERRERNQSAVEQAIAALPIVRRDYAAAQTFEQNTVRGVENSEMSTRQSLDNLRNARIRQGNEQFKTQAKVVVTKRGTGTLQEDAPSANKSYQGNLTKLLRQVHMNEMENNRNSALSGKQAGSFVRAGQVRGAGFYNSAAAHSQVDKPSTTDLSQWDVQMRSQPSGERQDANVSPDITGPVKRSSNLIFNSSGEKIVSKAESQEDNAYRVKANRHSQQKQLRVHSQTPAEEPNEGGFEARDENSPKPTKRTVTNIGIINSHGPLTRSFEQGRLRDSTCKKVQYRETRKLPMNPIYMGPEMPQGQTEQNSRGLKPTDVALATSTSQIITDTQKYGSRDDQLTAGKNLPINSKLNAALRHNARPGLGPCLEERQLGMIDKIWGRFHTEQSQQPPEPNSSQKKLTSAREVENRNLVQPVQLIKPQTRRQRNEASSHMQSVETQRIPQSEQQPQARSLLNRPQQIDISTERRQVLTGDNTPVWLPKKDLIQRNPNAPFSTANGSKSQAIENAASAMKRVTDEQFDYKDFNFIVNKQQRMNQQNSEIVADSNLYLNSNHEKGSHSNSPTSGRYEKKPQSDKYFMMKQFEQKKRLSTELVPSSSKLENHMPNNQTVNQSNLSMLAANQPASIKIQIDDPKIVRKVGAANENQPAYVPLLASQSNLYKMNTSSSKGHEQAQPQPPYQSLSSKKKNQNYWQPPVVNSKPSIEEMMPKYHVTIQIDPTVRSPPAINSKRGSPQLQDASKLNSQHQPSSNTPQSPYQYPQNYNVVKQQVVPVKQHVIPGLTGNYNVGSSTLVDPTQHNYFEQQLIVQRHSAGAQAMNSAQLARLNNQGMLSPRSSERRNNLMVFSPEPKLIELPGDEARMKTLPIMYPIIPKRQTRGPVTGKGQSISGLGHIDERSGVEYLMQQVGNRLGPDNIFHSNEYPFRLDPADIGSAKYGHPGHTCIEHGGGSQHHSSLQRKQRQQYLCPYASAKIAKLREEKAKARVDAREAREAAEAKRPKKDKQQNNGEGSANETGGEESKLDSRTAEQKAEDLKNHQRELLRKFVSKFPPKKLPNIHAELEEERQRFMQARKDAHRKYTEISANNNKPGKLAPLKFVIFEGNNSNIVRKVMQSRLACNMPQNEASSPSSKQIQSSTTDTTGDELDKKGNVGQHYPAISMENKVPQGSYTTWQETNTPHLFNFKWKPFSNGINFERLGKFGYKQLVNHIEGHQALTTKDQLFFNMKAYCEKRNLDVYDMIPLTFAVDFSEPNHQQKFDQILQIVSLFEKNISLTPNELSQKLQAAQSSYDKVVRSPLSVGPSDHQGKNLWLLKPTGFNRGIGIHVFNSLEDLQNILWTHYRIGVSIPQPYRSSQSPSTAEGDQQAARDARDKEIQKLSNQIAQDELKEGEAAGAVREIKNSSFIVQKYIEAPLLFRKRKFDIRIWALISHDMKLFMFKEAYVRTSSEEYDLSGEKLDQVYVHLTNNAVQKYSKNYGMFEEGNIVSVKTLSWELSQQEQFQSSLQSHEIENSLYEQMREQIIHSYEAVRSKLKFTRHTFELVGYDFMVVPVQESEGEGAGKCSFKTRLIEANTNPCLEESNQLLKEMIPRMLDDMLKIALDPLFGTTLVPNPVNASETETGMPVVLEYPIEGYNNNENMFELLTNPPNPY